MAKMSSIDFRLADVGWWDDRLLFIQISMQVGSFFDLHFVLFELKIIAYIKFWWW